MRIVIVGGGQIGYPLARALAADHECSSSITIATSREHYDDRRQFLVGSGTSEEVLERAGIREARLLVACTGLDEVNIVACAIANRLANPGRLLRLREDFLPGSKQLHLEQFGIKRVLWPEAQLAEEIEASSPSPGAIDAELFAGGRIRLLEYRLERGLAADVRARSGTASAARLADRRRQARRQPVRAARRTQLAAGDKIIVMGTPDAMRQVEPSSTRRGRRPHSRHDHRRRRRRPAAGRAARAIQRFDVRIIERELARGEMLAARLKRTLVLNGDGTDLELLERENIGRSDVLVWVIDNDERNLLASLLGRQLGVPKIVTRVSRPANLRLFERVGIDVALSARGAAVASIVHQITGGTSSLLAVVEQGEARVSS